MVDQFESVYQRESFRLLGIPEEKVLESRQLGLFQAKKLIVPSRPTTPGWVQDWGVKLLQKEFAPALNAQDIEPIYGERIYISRGKAGYRKIENEAEIELILNTAQFKKVFFESMTLQEQAAAVMNAKVIVAPHGAGLTNLIYAVPGVKILEIFPSHYINVCYWTLSNQLGLEYYYLTAMSTNPQEYPARQNMCVDPTSLSNTLSLMGI